MDDRKPKDLGLTDEMADPPPTNLADLTTDREET